MRGLVVGEVFRRAARTYPNRPAVSFEGRVLTFGGVHATAARLATVLRGRGVRRGDVLAWWGDTALEPVALFAAAAYVGAAFAPVNARLGDDEAAPVVDRAAPAITVGDDARAGHLGAVALAELLDEAAGADPGDEGGAGEGPEEGDAHVVFFTSGSTGAPKGVVISHRADMLRTLPGYRATPGGATLCMFPQFHMAAWTLGLGCWQAGDECIFVATPDAPTLLAAVDDRRPRRLYLIPAVWRRLLDAGLGGHDLSCVRDADTGTSATPPELLAAIADAIPHAEIRVAYGSTEAGPGTVLGPADTHRKAGSVGLACPGVEVRLSDEGEILLRSPFLMDGYLGDDAATADVMLDGWYRSGDLGAFDDEGYLYVVGRRRDVIRTGGETVAPTEVEAVLATHPAVADVAVVGVPDPVWGEVVCAVVVAREPVDVDGLRAHCDGRLAPFKHPRRIAVVDALPRTAATGQVQRALLIERLVAAGEPGRPGATG